MSEDLTRKLPSSDTEKMNLILTTVQNLSTTVQKLSTTVENLTTTVENLSIRVDNLNATVQNLVTDVADIKVRLANLEQKVEERLYDTRPIWEKLSAEISQLRSEALEFKTSLTEEMREVKTHLLDIYRRLGNFNDTLITIQVGHRDISDRLGRLELRQT